jgi:hypothetical protein
MPSGRVRPDAGRTRESPWLGVLRHARNSDASTAGDEFMLHPTLVYSPGHNVLVFGIVSVPVWRSFEDPAARDTYRFGTGVVYAW